MMRHGSGDVKAKGRGPVRPLLLSSGALLGAAVGAALLPVFHLWGINHLSYLPWQASLALVLLSLATLSPVLQRGFLRLGSSIVPALARSLPSWMRRWWWCIVPFCSFPLFWGLRSRTSLGGDGTLLIQALELGRAFRWTEPLSHYLYTSLHILTRGMGSENPMLAYSLGNCVAGVLFVGLVLLMSRDLAEGAGARAVIFCSLVASGAVQLFFGHVENYSLFYLACLVFLWVGMRLCLGRSSLAQAALALSLAITLHLAALCLAPSLIFLAVIELRRGERSTAKSLVGSVIALLAPPLLVAGTFALTGIRPGDIDRPTVEFLLPLFGGEETAYALLSPRHLLDLLNEYLLVGWPAIPLLASFLVHRHPLDQGKRALRRALPFLVTCGMLFGLFGLIANPSLGMARDWDLFAVVGLPWLLVALSLFVGDEARSGDYATAVFAVAAVALVVTIPWILTNADEERSVARFRDSLDYYADLPLTPYGHEILSIHFRDRHMIEEETRELERAAELAPRNYRYAANLGIAYYLSGRSEGAITQFRRAVELAPDRFENHVNLARAYHMVGDEERAIDSLEAALALAPRYVEGRFGLAGLYSRAGRIEEAVAEYEQVIKLAPTSPFAVQAQMRLQELYRARDESGE
jgi:hypothetical protein